jgi:hypothetical protein
MSEVYRITVVGSALIVNLVVSFDAGLHAWEIVAESGDVPIGLEILTRAAKLWSQLHHTSAPLKVILFVLRQPALLAESRAAAQELAAHLQADTSAVAIANTVAAATTTDFATIALEVLKALQSISSAPQ